MKKAIMLIMFIVIGTAIPFYFSITAKVDHEHKEVIFIGILMVETGIINLLAFIRNLRK